MPKKPRVRTLMERQHVKVSETLLESSQQELCHIFFSIWKSFSSKKIFLVVSQIFRLSVNVLPPNGKYSLSVKMSVWRIQFKCNFLQNPKRFLVFFSISDIYIKFWTFSKKPEAHTVFISEVIDWKNRRYLNASKGPCQNTYGMWTC